VCACRVMSLSFMLLYLHPLETLGIEKARCRPASRTVCHLPRVPLILSNRRTCAGRPHHGMLESVLCEVCVYCFWCVCVFILCRNFRGLRGVRLPGVADALPNSPLRIWMSRVKTLLSGCLRNGRGDFGCQRLPSARSSQVLVAASLFSPPRNVPPFRRGPSELRLSLFVHPEAAEFVEV